MSRHQGHWFFFYAGLLVRVTALILSIVILILNTTLRLDLDWIAVSLPPYVSQQISPMSNSQSPHVNTRLTGFSFHFRFSQTPMKSSTASFGPCENGQFNRLVFGALM